MTAADKQEIGVLKNYIESILPNMLDFCFDVVLAVIVYLIGGQSHQSNPEDEQTLGRPQGN